MITLLFDDPFVIVLLMIIFVCLFIIALYALFAIIAYIHYYALRIRRPASLNTRDAIREAEMVLRAAVRAKKVED